MPVTLSQDFICHVHELYQRALVQISSGSVVRQGINGFTDRAAPAIVSSAAAVETHINEMTFGMGMQMFFPESPLWELDQDWVEKLELRNKLVIVPQLVFGRSFRRDSQPYQDMLTLIKIRNDFAHFKMPAMAPKYLGNLRDRGYALKSHPSVADYDWVHALSTSELIRWSYNTACLTVKAFIAMIPDDARRMLGSLESNFEEIPRTYAEDFLRQRGIDPTSSFPSAT